MQKKIPLVCVVGPTASGKTRLAIELAKQFSGEIVSADSMQIYRFMNIGTAKPTPQEMCGIPHHCIDFVEPDQTFSVAEYVDCARRAINDIDTRGKLPIVAGGTGLYVSSLCDHLQFTPSPSSEELRRELQELGQQQGGQHLWNLLQEVDPELAAKLHPNNQGRVIRGIETFQLTGITMSEQQRRSRLIEPPYALCMLGLACRGRETLYERINHRVDLMLEQGLLDEVRALQQRGYSKTSIQAIGYKEFFDYLDGAVSLEQVVERVKQESRRYAKRQLTWFRRDERIHWLYSDDYPDFEPLAHQAAELVREKVRM